MAVSASAIEAWDVRAGCLIRRDELAGPISDAVLSPGATLTALVTEDGSVEVLDTSSSETLVGSLRLAASPARGLAFSPDSSLLATGHDDGTVVLWDLATGAVERTIAAHENNVQVLAFGHDGTRLATGRVALGNERPGPTVSVWDVATGEQVGASLQPNGPGAEGLDERFAAEAAAFSSDGSTLTTVGRPTLEPRHGRDAQRLPPTRR